MVVGGPRFSCWRFPFGVAFLLAMLSHKNLPFFIVFVWFCSEVSCLSVAFVEFEFVFTVAPSFGFSLFISVACSKLLSVVSSLRFCLWIVFFFPIDVDSDDKLVYSCDLQAGGIVVNSLWFASSIARTIGGVIGLGRSDSFCFSGGVRLLCLRRFRRGDVGGVDRTFRFLVVLTEVFLIRLLVLFSVVSGGPAFNGRFRSHVFLCDENSCLLLLCV